MAINEKATTTVDVNGKNADEMIQKLAKSAKKYRDAIKEAQKAGDLNAWKKNDEALKKVNQDINNLKKSSFDTAKVLKNLNGTNFNDLSRAKKVLIKDIKKLNQGTAEYIQKSNDLQKVTGQLKKVKGEMFGTTKQTSLWGKAMSGIKSLMPALGLGTILLGAKRVVDFTTKLRGLRKEVKSLTDMTGASLNTTTARAMSIAEVYDKDFNKVLEATNNLSKQMNISFSESFDLIEKGFQAGADVNGEFLDNLREYPAYFREAGYNAEQFIVAISKQTKDGIFSDKGVDAIKEANIRLRELTPATKEALENIGISSKEMSEKLQSGEMKMSEAISMVSKKLAEMPPQSQEVGQALADIFGGPGEDAGIQFISTLSEVNEGLESMVDNTDDLTISQQNNLVASKELNEAYLKMLGQGSAVSKLWSSIKKQTGTELNDLATVINNKELSLFQKMALLGNKTKREGIATGIQAKEILNAEEEAYKQFNTELIKTAQNIGIEIDLNKLSNEQIQELIDKRQVYLNTIKDEEAQYKKLQETLEKVKKIDAAVLDKKVKITESELRKLTANLGELNLDWLEVQGDEEIALMEEIEQRKQNIRRQYGLVTLEEEKRKELEFVGQAYVDGLLSYEEYEAAKKDIKDRYKIAQLEQDIADAETDEEEKNLKLVALEEEYANGLIREEEYQRQKKAIVDKYNQAQVDSTQQMWSKIATETAKWGGAIMNLTGAISNRYEQSKQRELKAAGDNAKEKDRIEKKYAKKQKNIALTQAIINTAMGVTQALGGSPPPLSFIMAALVGAAGAVEIGTINSAQYAKGKYNVRGADDGKVYNSTVSKGTTGVYSEPTFTPGFGLFGETADPEMVIDGKTFRNIQMNTPSLIDSIMAHRVPQFAEGDYSNAGSSQGLDMGQIEALIQKSTEVNAMLSAQLAEGIKAEAFYNNEQVHKIRTETRKLDSIENGASRN